MPELLRSVHSDSLVRLGSEREDVVVLSADLTSSTEAETFKLAYPDRFFSMGMAEQNMMSVAGGMAREGLVPLVHDFAVFMYRRALDQIEMSIAYPNLPVKMLGFLPGIATPGGVSHQAINDLAVMTALPNVSVLECADARDVQSVLDVACAIDGPVYVRMLRGSLPRLFEAPMRFRRGRLLSSTGRDVVLLSSGVCTADGMDATSQLMDSGVGIAHIGVSTLSPFDDQQVLDAVSEARLGVITVENHLVTGGLGTATATLMAERGLATRLVRLGLRSYGRGGSQHYLQSQYGIDTKAIVHAIADMAGLNVESELCPSTEPTVAEDRAGPDEAL